MGTQVPETTLVTDPLDFIEALHQSVSELLWQAWGPMSALPADSESSVEDAFVWPLVQMLMRETTEEELAQQLRFSRTEITHQEPNDAEDVAVATQVLANYNLLDERTDLPFDDVAPNQELY